MLRTKLIISCIAIFNIILPLRGFCQVDLNLGLVAYYPFNGNANDESGNNYHGVQVNGVTPTTDRFGNANKAFQFDGVNDYIKISDNGSFSSPHFSLVVWFKSESDALQNIVGKREFNTVSGTAGAQYQMFINYAPFPGIGSNIVGNNSTCSNISSSSYLNTGNNICSNKWYCGVITFDGKNHKMYINGELKRDEVTNFNAFLSCKSELRFGNWWSGDLLPFKGILDDIRWYNRALSQDEVEAIYGGFPSVAPNLNITDIGMPCNGGTANLTASSVTAGSDAGLSFTYWKDAAATVILSNPNAVNSGTYYIKANAGSNCSVIKPIVVTTSSNPKITITDPKVCSPSIIDLTSASITAGSDVGLAYTYWRDATATIPLPLTQAIALNASGTYYIRAQNASGCTSIKSVNATIEAPPALTISNPLALCAPDTYNLSNAIVSTTSGLTISYWKDALASIPLNSVEAASIATSGTYYIKANNASCFKVEPVHISIKPQPFLAIKNPSPVCEPLRIDLTSSSLTAGSEPGLLFSYFKDNAAVVPVVDPTSVGTGVYHIKGVASTGCSSIKTVNVSILSKPVFAIDPLEKTLCSGESTTFLASGGDVYSWFTKNNNAVIASGPNLTYKPNVTDSVFVEIISSICQVKDTLGGLVTLSPIPAIVLTKSNDIDCQNPKAQLTAAGGIHFEWSPKTYIETPLSQNPVVYPIRDTWFKVRVTGQNNCVNEDSILVHSSLALGGGKFFVTNAFTPNGDGKNDCFSVKYWTAVSDFELSVFDRWGKRLFYTTESSDCWDGTYNRKMQPAGTYIYQIKASSPCSIDPVYLKGHINLIR